MSAENWHDERDRLVKLLKALEAGSVTHVDRAGQSELHRAGTGDIARLRARLATLNARVGDDGA